MNTQLFRAIDGLKLPAEHRALLRPGESESDSHGNVHQLPRFFYEVASWQEAHEIRLAPHFKLAELMTVDCREAELLLRDCLARAFFGRFSPGSGRTGFCKRKWWLPVARAPDGRREKHSCLGHSRRHLPSRRHFSR